MTVVRYLNLALCGNLGRHPSVELKALRGTYMVRARTAKPARDLTRDVSLTGIATFVHHLTVLALFTPERVVHFPHLFSMEIAQWIMGS